MPSSVAGGPSADESSLGAGPAFKRRKSMRLCAHDHAIGVHVSTGSDQDPLNPSVARRGHPARIDRNQHAWAAHFAQHRAALNRIDPHARPLDPRRVISERHYGQQHGHGKTNRGDDPNQSAANFLYFVIGARDVHVTPHCSSHANRSNPRGYWLFCAACTRFVRNRTGTCRESGHFNQPCHPAIRWRASCRVFSIISSISSVESARSRASFTSS